MECLDVLTDSPKWYHKKHVENSVENMHVDIGGLKGLIQVSLWLLMMHIHVDSQPIDKLFFSTKCSIEARNRTDHLILLITHCTFHNK